MNKTWQEICELAGKNKVEIQELVQYSFEEVVQIYENYFANEVARHTSLKGKVAGEQIYIKKFKETILQEFVSEFLVKLADLKFGEDKNNEQMEIVIEKLALMDVIIGAEILDDWESLKKLTELAIVVEEADGLEKMKQAVLDCYKIK